MSDWWKKSVVYQIYPQSFNDSNNDGIGDIQGIIEKLPYLEELGVDVLWLNPIYVSPLVDNGYDIADYYKINPDYGTLDDFKELLEKAHEKKIRIIMDLVVNHTSDQNQWFLESKKGKDNKYSDFYIWRNPKADGSEPNNWGSTFGGSAWTYVPERKQYYLHLFAKEQPDLNWENEQVRQTVYEMMRYWLDLGIDGFRMDVISLISKRPGLPDAPKDLPYSKNYYFGASNGPRVHEFLQEMNQEVLSKYDCLTVGETANTTSDQAVLYTDPDRHELSMVFQFDHMHLDYGEHGKFSNVRFKMSDLRNVMTEWEDKLENHGWNSLYWSNHDQPRGTTRFGDDGMYRVESAKMLGTLLHMMKGTPYVFEGEELGMKDVPFKSLTDYRDIESLNMIKELESDGLSQEEIRKIMYLRSRDNTRTPMPWDDGYGFSEAEPWIAYSSDNENINVNQALNDPESVFWYYKKLIQLRKTHDVIIDGKYEVLNQDDSCVYNYKRQNNDEQLLVICSFSPEPVRFTIPDEFFDQEILISNYHRKPCHGTIILKPYEAIVISKKNS